MDTLEKLKKQFPFNTSKEPPVVDPVKVQSGFSEKTWPKSWEESKPIKELSEFLKTCNGIKLLEHEGRPTLHFQDGITPQNQDRWSQAIKAFDLLVAAQADIDHLLEKGTLKLEPRGSF